MSRPGDLPAPDGPVLVEAGRVIRPGLRGARFALFALRLPAAGLRLRSVPGRGEAGDQRRLGFAVTRLRLLRPGGARQASLAELAACEGFHPVESDAWCWSDGDAALPDALFAGPPGPAALLLEGFSTADAAVPPQVPALWLAGDSHPRDGHVAEHLLAALAPLFGGHAMHLAEQGPRPIAERLAGLHRALDGMAHPERAVLIGRSSGARVATLCAAERRLGAVICLGYPFQPQGWPPEPARYAHLAHLATPTLILQGNEDIYGGAEAAGRYPLSPAVRLQLVPATHEFLLDAAGWATLGRHVALFLAAGQGR